MRVAGHGSDPWHVRVDLIAPDCDGSRVGSVAGALLSILHGDHEGPGLGMGVDEGLGVEGQPVLGPTGSLASRYAKRPGQSPGRGGSGRPFGVP